MIIGLDITSLQGPHRMRGIGYTLINFVQNIPSDLRAKHSFVFFHYPSSDMDEILGLLDLKGITFELRPIQSHQSMTKKSLPGKMGVIFRIVNSTVSNFIQSSEDTRIKDLSGVDVFLQTDQMLALPAAHGVKKAFVAYDLIPYVLEWDYLWNYRTARMHGLPRQAALRCVGRRWMYIHKLRVNTKKADAILAISDATAQDFMTHLPASRKKIQTVPLGVNQPRIFSNAVPTMSRYISSSWGYLKKPYKIAADTSFLLFVGGADKRRKLDELVVAFNHLRGQGHDIKLVLAGDSMQGPRNISTEIIQNSLLASSYLDDIIFMGFVDDEQRDWLYKHALAFVFPSVYEGFGLPVLEAFTYGTPVISYRNAATVEVAGDGALYANGPLELVATVKALLNQNDNENQKQTAKRNQRVKNFSWQKTSRKIIESLESLTA